MFSVARRRPTLARGGWPRGTRSSWSTAAAPKPRVASRRVARDRVDDRRRARLARPAGGRAARSTCAWRPCARSGSPGLPRRPPSSARRSLAARRQRAHAEASRRRGPRSAAPPRRAKKPRNNPRARAGRGSTDPWRTLRRSRDSKELQRFLLDPRGEPLPAELPLRDAALLIGPEGGWSDAEHAAAIAAGWVAASLASGKLRAETAAVAGLALVRSALARAALARGSH